MEMKTLQKFNLFNKKNFNIIVFVIILLIVSVPVSAEYYQSGLIDFVKSSRQISVPIFSPAKKIEIIAEADTILKASGSDDFKLEQGKSYFVTQGQIKTETAELKSGWGVQIMASSTEAKAEDFKNQAAVDIDKQLMIKEEEGLYKILAGAFTEREGAEEFQQQLKGLGYNGWVREVEVEGGSTEVEVESTEAPGQVAEGLNLYGPEGNKIRAAHIFKIEGQFKAGAHQMEGEFQFGPIGNSVLFSYKSNLDELTAYLLQYYFNPGAPLEALKAQSILYRTALLYQLETQGARLENLNQLSFGALDPIFKKAAVETSKEVLIKGDEFYYNSNFSLKEIIKPRAGIVPLAQASYKYDEIINYYYERSEIANLNELIDSEVKFTARINRGLNFKEIRQVSWSGPRVITVVDYDLSEEQLELRPVLAQGIVPGREDLADIIKRNSALAGINGGYFHYSGRPLGLLYINQTLVSEPLYNRTALLIDENGQPSFSQIDWEGQLQIEGISEPIPFNGVNRAPSLSEAVVYNSYYGADMPALAENYYDIVIRSEEILGVENEPGSKTPIPPDGYIIRLGANRSDLRHLIPELKGKKIKLKNKFSPDLEAQDILHALGGGPRLLANGEVKITGAEESFQNDILNGRAPRTALGLTADNHLLMLTIDGRQSALSVGMTLEETAETLRGLGAVEAMNLDGGGSARVVIRGFTMSNPSEKRLISNGVIVDKEK